MLSMADTRTYSNPKGPRRTASSHIPVPTSRRRANEAQHRHSAAEPSHLLMMQNRYQQQLLREKEEKLIQMYQDNQDITLGRVTGSSANKRGIVRDFFRERHRLEQSHSEPSLNRTEHFQRKKRHNRGELDRMEREKESQLHRLKRANSERLLSQHQQAVMSWSNPLAPIKRGQSQSQDVLHNEPSDHTFGYNRRQVQFNERLPSNQTESKSLPQNVQRSSNSKTQIKPRLEQPTSYSDPKGDGNKPRDKNKLIEQPDKLKSHQIKQKSEPSRIVDPGNEGISGDRKQRSQPKKKSPRWKPPATYSDEDESDESPSPNFPKVAQVRRKQDQPTKRQNGSTKQMSDFHKWQLEQDLERANRLERYQRELDNNQEPDYRFDRDLKEQRAKQQQRKKELDEMEQQQSYMRELEEKIARKQLELSKLGDDLESEPSLSPRQSKAKPKSKSSPTRNSKQEPFSQNPEFDFSHESPSYESNTVASIEYIPPKPAKVQPSKRKPKTNQKQKQTLPPVSIQENEDDMPQVSTASFYTEFADMSEDAVANVDLGSCPTCGRQFAGDRLNKHAKVCQNVAKKKPRKVFDMQKHRLDGTELAAYVEHGKHKEDERPKKKSNWREKHNELVRAVQDARKYQKHVAKGGDPRDLPAPPAAQHSDYKQCPHCQRRFDPTVAERHIPKCSQIKSRPPPPKKLGKRR